MPLTWVAEKEELAADVRDAVELPSFGDRAKIVELVAPRDTTELSSSTWVTETGDRVDAVRDVIKLPSFGCDAENAELLAAREATELLSSTWAAEKLVALEARDDISHGCWTDALVLQDCLESWEVGLSLDWWIAADLPVPFEPEKDKLSMGKC